MKSNPTLAVQKAHAYGNDFLFVRDDDVANVDRSALARAMCDRHCGIGADGLIFFTASNQVPLARMRLLNSDGSAAEVSGNGVRCLGALLAHEHQLTARGALVHVDTDAGRKELQLIAAEGSRFTFRASMGQPAQIKQERLDVAGRRIEAVTLWVGNPQCVVIGPLPSDADFRLLGPALERHPRFAARTNVEFAEIERRDAVRILIWERGAGQTRSSGTGSCAAAVAAAAYGGADREVQVTAPGGTQRVEWREDGLFLTGWAEIVLRGEWLAR